jgi:hypothetical protein
MNISDSTQTANERHSESTSHETPSGKIGFGASPVQSKRNNKKNEKY